MTLTVIILVIAAGLLFVLAEILVLPGGIVGLFGIALMATGIYFAYQLPEPMTGHYVLGGTLILTGTGGYLALKGKTWRKAMLDSNIDAKVNTLDESPVAVGDKGETVSRLAPMGKARIGGHYIEVKSNAAYVDERTPIEVTKVEGNQVTVKSIAPPDED